MAHYTVCVTIVVFARAGHKGRSQTLCARKPNDLARTNEVA